MRTLGHSGIFLRLRRDEATGGLAEAARARARLEALQEREEIGVGVKRHPCFSKICPQLDRLLTIST